MVLTCRKRWQTELCTIKVVCRHRPCSDGLLVSVLVEHLRMCPKDPDCNVTLCGGGRLQRKGSQVDHAELIPELREGASGPCDITVPGTSQNHGGMKPVLKAQSVAKTEYHQGEPQEALRA